MAKRPTSKPDADRESDAPPTFEEAVAMLESIIERIESGEIGLERSIEEYEKGAALLRRCRQILEKAEQRVTELTAPRAGEKQAGRAEGARSRRPADEAPF